MPRAKYKGRGKVLRYRTKSLNGSYLTCAVMTKKGKSGGKTVCTKHKKKKK